LQPETHGVAAWGHMGLPLRARGAPPRLVVAPRALNDAHVHGLHLVRVRVGVGVRVG